MLNNTFEEKFEVVTEMSESSRSADSVKVSLGVLREIEVDHNVYGHNDNTSCKQVSAYQTACFTLLEVVVNSNFSSVRNNITCFCQLAAS